MEMLVLNSNKFSLFYVVPEEALMSRLDEPLDMSLKSRKRSPVHEYLPKKKRASVIARSPKVDGGLPLEATEMKPKIEVDSPHQSPSMSRKSHILNDLLTGGERYERLPVTIRIPAQSFPVPHRVIINNEVEGGLEEHFRRSLCREFYVDVETEGGKIV